MHKILGIAIAFGSIAWGDISNLVMPAGPYTPGQVVSVSWTVVSSPDEAYTGIYFSSTGSAPWDSVGRISKTASSYQWTVPNKLSTTAKLWIFHADTADATEARPTNPVAGAHTLISNTFTIRSSTPILEVNSHGRFSLRQAGNFLTIDVGGFNFKNASAEICALNGKTLVLSKFHSGSTLSMSTASLPTGNAILRYKVDGQPEIGRLIQIQR